MYVAVEQQLRRMVTSKVRSGVSRVERLVGTHGLVEWALYWANHTVPDVAPQVRRVKMVSSLRACLWPRGSGSSYVGQHNCDRIPTHVNGIVSSARRFNNAFHL